MKTILIIEDNEADQFLGEMIITGELPDVEILTAKDGEEALTITKAHDEKLDLILLDINMPRMDGHQFLEQFSDGNSREIPVVVMLTSSALPQDKEKALAYKCVRDYLVKPIKPEYINRLIELVEKYG